VSGVWRLNSILPAPGRLSPTTNIFKNYKKNHANILTKNSKKNPLILT
jgi:hypothetical protein